MSVRADARSKMKKEYRARVRALSERKRALVDQIGGRVGPVGRLAAELSIVLRAEETGARAGSRTRGARPSSRPISSRTRSSTNCSLSE